MASDMSRTTTGSKNVSQKSAKRYTSRPVLWGLRGSCGLFEPTVYGTRVAAVVASAAYRNDTGDALEVVPLYAKKPASK